METPTRTLLRCLVCGSSEVRTDEVVDHGLVMLAECPRCEHRWTRRQAGAAHKVRGVSHGANQVGETRTAA